jgi:uncharacterized protein YbbC (DUF1343 family)
MGRAYNVSIPASGVGVDPIPISVSGCTIFSGEIAVQFAYDPADFAGGQFALMNTAMTGYSPKMIFPANTILWVRQDPAMGLPAGTFFIHTQISEVVA